MACPFGQVHDSYEEHPAGELHARGSGFPRAHRKRVQPQGVLYGPGVRPLAVHKRHGGQVWIKSRPVGGRTARPGKIYTSGGGIFKDFYGMFGSWPLAMASYNAGEGNVARAINRTGGVQDFWKLRKTRYMPSETKDYVPKFIAARMIAQNPDNFGFKDQEYDQPFVFEEVQLDHCTDLRTVALCCGVSIEEIKDLNPELIKSCTPPNRTYTLRIPKGKKEQFLAAYNALPKDERFATPKIFAANARYVVRRSETLKSIAGKLGVPVAKLAAANHLKVRSQVRRGKRLLVPRERLIIAAEIPRSLPNNGGRIKTRYED